MQKEALPSLIEFLAGAGVCGLSPELPLVISVCCQVAVLMALGVLSAEGSVILVKMLHGKSVLSLSIPVAGQMRILFVAAVAAAADGGVSTTSLLTCGTSSAVPGHWGRLRGGK